MEAKTIFETGKSIFLLLKSILDLFSGLPTYPKYKKEIINWYLSLEEYLLVKKDFILFIKLLKNNGHKNKDINQIIFQGEMLSELISKRNYNLYLLVKKISNQMNIMDEDFFIDLEPYFDGVRGTIIFGSNNNHVRNIAEYRSLMLSEKLKLKHFEEIYKFAYVDNKFFIGKLNVQSSECDKFLNIHTETEELLNKLLVDLRNYIQKNFTNIENT